jgi:hypothetical protein
VTLVVLALSGACDGSSSPTRPTPAPVPPVLPAPNFYNPLDGAYTLTLQIGSSCSAIPDAEKIRVYEASIGQVANRTDLGHLVTLTGAHFLTGPICTSASGRFAGIGCDQFFASEDIDWVGFFLQINNDQTHGGHIVEQTSSGGWLEISGRAEGALNSHSSIDASGMLDVGVCLTPSDYPYPCPEYRFCPSTDAHLRLDRK